MGKLTRVTDALVTVKTSLSGTIKRLLLDKMKEHVSVADFGAVGDFISDDTQAFIAAVNSGVSRVYVPAGRYKLTSGISLPMGVTIVGDGIDYWDTYRPDQNRLKKSWSKGTHLVFCGTGAKTKQFFNISNERPEKTIDGVVCGFSDFTNKDASGSNPATARLLSVAVSASAGAGIEDLRIMLNNDGIDGYNDYTSVTKLGDQWDVGLHVFDSSDCIFRNVQVAGYWKFAGTLLTENDGSITQRGNPERTLFDKFFTQGIRGLLIRNSPQVDVVSNTSDSVTFKFNPTTRIAGVKGFRVAGNSTLYSFSGCSMSGGNLTLTGVSPALPASVSVIRFPSIGNNWSGTNFLNTVVTSFEHSSGKSSDELGLPVSFALEMDGYPMRNIKFSNFKAQTTYDKGNTIFGDCRDVKLLSSEFENGILVAYSLSETQGYTGNLRMVNTDISPTVNTSEFTPRDCYYEAAQFPTMFSDGSFVIKNWRKSDVKLQWFNGNDFIRLFESDGTWRIKNIDGNDVLWYSGSSKDISMFASNVSFKNTDNQDVLKWFGVSGNFSFKGIGSPISDNTVSWGTGSNRFTTGFFVNGVQSSSDSRLKKPTRPLTAQECNAAIELSKCIGVWEWAEGGDRLHVGLTVQKAIEVMRANGLNPFLYSFICYDEWPDEYIDGELVKRAGDIYSFRDNELHRFIMYGLNQRLLSIEGK